MKWMSPLCGEYWRVIYLRNSDSYTLYISDYYKIPVLKCSASEPQASSMSAISTGEQDLEGFLVQITTDMAGH